MFKISSFFIYYFIIKFKLFFLIFFIKGKRFALLIFMWDFL
ncbi:hypothetical protein K661_03244 [Piscirickettsia salmonis LF-89 = ATCC VR-1361]|nr:hypothetical protein K661_03244 [Piscirickettsia salmonis LF-89 = ATCC VR-1361]